MKDFLHGITFRKKLIISYAIISFIALTIFAAFFIIRFNILNTQSITFSLSESAPVIASTIERNMNEVEVILSVVHADSTIQSTLRLKPVSSRTIYSNEINELSNILLTADLFRAKTRVIQIFGINKPFYPDYENVSQHTNIVFNNTQVEQMSWYQQALSANGQTHWCLNDGDSVAKANTIFAARAIKSVNNPQSTIGILRAVIDYESFLDPLGTTSFNKDGKAFLISDGHPVTMKDEPILSDEHFTELYPRLLKDNGADINTRWYLASSYKLKKNDWYVVTVVPRSSITAENIPFTVTVISIWLFLILFTMFFVMRLSSFLSKPINQLCDNMLKFGNERNVIVNSSTDEEIGRLYNSFNAMVGKIDDLIEKEKTAVHKREQAELRILQAQINPHFTYNTLESIKALVLKGDGKSAAVMITNFGNFLRRSLNNGKHYTTIEQELMHVGSYVEIQKIRYCNAFEYRTSIDPSVLPYITVCTILQPIVENCIIHGFANIEHIGIITITGFEEDGMIYLEISDSGSGADTQFLNELVKRSPCISIDEDKYYCIRNVWLRLESFFENPSMTFETNRLGGITVIIKINKITKYDKENL